MPSLHGARVERSGEAKRKPRAAVLWSISETEIIVSHCSIHCHEAISSPAAETLQVARLGSVLLVALQLSTLPHRTRLCARYCVS